MTQDSQPRCSFCKRPRNEVKHLIGIDKEPLICNRCVKDVLTAMKDEDLKSGSSTKKKEEPLRKPREIKAYLDENVIGQDRAKEDIAVAVYDHFKRRELSKLMDQEDRTEVEKSNILLMGPSGCGKTHIARAVARLLKVPFYIGDATRLTQSGYVGDDVETLLQGLLQDAGGDVEKAQWGIIFLDEADKMAKKSGRGATGYRDVSGEAVQQSLLKMIEGGKVPVPRGVGAKMIASGIQPTDTIDTQNILFIFAGSFAGIEEVVDRRVNRNARLGFGSVEIDRKKLSKTDVYLDISEDDLLDFGIIPELLGRLPVRTSVLELTEDELIRVLTEPRNSLIKQKTHLFSFDGIALRFEDEALKAIAKEARAMTTGARALRTIVERVLRPFAYTAPSEGDIVSITITADTVVKGESHAVIMRRSAGAVGVG